MRGGIQQKDADLAVLASSGCPAVLPCHSCRFLSLLDEPCLIDHQHPIGLCQVLGDIGPQVITHGVLVPVRLPQQPLHTAWSVLSQLLRQLPAVLALDWRQQSFQEAARPASHLGASKSWCDALMHLSKGFGSCSHCPQFVLALLFSSFLYGHLLHPSEAVYHFLL